MKQQFSQIDPAAHRDVLQQMLADMEMQDGLYRPAPFWSQFIPEFMRYIYREDYLDGLERNYRRWWISRATFVPHYSKLHQCTPEMKNYMTELRALIDRSPFSDDRFRLKMHALLDGSLEAFQDFQLFRATEKPGFPELSKFSESEAGRPREQFFFEGARFSMTSLSYLRLLNFWKAHRKSESLRNVIEIGGGFGSLGEILLQTGNQKVFYVDCDIPPISWIADRYLKDVFGSDRIAGYEITREMSEIDLEAIRESYDAMIICPWQLPRLKAEFQLAVNSISFQEMEPEIVRNYILLIEPMMRGEFLLRNLREGKPVRNPESGKAGVIEPVTSEHYAAFFSAWERVAGDDLVFGKRNIDGFVSEALIYRKGV